MYGKRYPESLPYPCPHLCAHPLVLASREERTMDTVLNARLHHFVLAVQDIPVTGQRRMDGAAPKQPWTNQVWKMGRQQFSLAIPEIGIISHRV
jgi:hypothetical protein